MGLPRRVDKPWGYELWYALTDRYAGKILHVDHGHSLSLQYHERKDESNYLLRGRLRLTRGASVDDLWTPSSAPVTCGVTPPGLIHSIEALDDTDVLEVSTPDYTTWGASRTTTGAADNPALPCLAECGAARSNDRAAAAGGEDREDGLAPLLAADARLPRRPRGLTGPPDRSTANASRSLIDPLRPQSHEQPARRP